MDKFEMPSVKTIESLEGGNSPMPVKHSEVDVDRVRAVLRVDAHDFNSVHQNLSQGEKNESESDKEFRTRFSPKLQEAITKLAAILKPEMTMSDFGKLADEDPEVVELLGYVKENIEYDSLGTLILAERIPMQEVKIALLPSNDDGAYHRYKKWMDEKVGADLAEALQENQVTSETLNQFLIEAKARERTQLFARVDRIGFTGAEEIAAQKLAVEKVEREVNEYRTMAVLAEATARLLSATPNSVPRLFEEIAKSEDPQLIEALKQLKLYPHSVAEAVNRDVRHIEDEKAREAAKLEILKKLPRDILVNTPEIRNQIALHIQDAKLERYAYIFEDAAQKIFIETGDFEVIKKFITDIARANNIPAHEKTREVIVKYVCAGGRETAASRAQGMAGSFELISKISDKVYYQHGMVNLATTSDNPNFIAEHEQQIVATLAKIDQWSNFVANDAQKKLLQEPDSYVTFGVTCEVIDALNDLMLDGQVPDAQIKSAIFEKQLKEKNPAAARELGTSISRLYDRFKKREYTIATEKEKECLYILAMTGKHDIIAAVTDKLDEMLPHIKTVSEKIKIPGILSEYLEKFAQSSDGEVWNRIAQEGAQAGEALDCIKDFSRTAELLFQAFKSGTIDMTGLRERAAMMAPLLKTDKLTVEMMQSLVAHAVSLKEVTPESVSQLLRASIKDLLGDDSESRSKEVVYMLGAFDQEMKQELRENSDQIAPTQLKQVIKALLDRFAYSFTDDEAGAIAKSKDSRDLAKILLKKIPESELDEFLPTAIEHSVDVDFGDKADAQEFIRMSKDSDKRAEYEKLLTQAPESFADRISKFADQLRVISAENAARDMKALVELHGQNIFDKTFQDVKNTLAITINASFQSLEKILDGGRLKSCWEVGARGSSDYREMRHNVERMLGIRSKGTLNDPHPVYGAVAAQEAATTLGAAPGYGETFIKLRTDRIKDRVSATYGDSFHYKDDPQKCLSQQYSFDDLAVARTRLELDKNKGYVEVQIQGFVTIDDIESINIPKHAESSAASLVAKYPNLIINFV